MSSALETQQVFQNGRAHLHSHQQPGKVTAPQPLPMFIIIWSLEFGHGDYLTCRSGFRLQVYDDDAAL